MSRLQKIGLVLVGALAFGPLMAYAATCALKVWSPGDVLTTTDLNGNFSCINTATPAGTPIVDATVATGAAIQYTKLNQPANFPRSWANVAHCTSGTCTTNAKSRITSVTRQSTGTYTVNLAYTTSASTYAVFLTNADSSPTANNGTICNVAAYNTTSFGIICVQPGDAGMSALIDPVSGFNLLVMDTTTN